jgi:uncharacterized protein
MSTSSNLSVESDKSHAFIITHTVKSGREAEYERWLDQILGPVSSFPGYLGREIFRPPEGTRKYTTITRFDSLEHLDAWVQSDIRKLYVERVRDLLEKGDIHEIRTGIDFWFTPEGARPPKPWKQFLLTLSAVYPLSLVILIILNSLAHLAPFISDPWINGALMAVILTASLTFLIMPRYTRLTKRWLYDET